MTSGVTTVAPNVSKALFSFFIFLNQMKNKKLYPWIVVGLLWVVALLNYMDRQMLSTMKSAMMVDIVELESAANSVTRDICDKRIGKKG